MINPDHPDESAANIARIWAEFDNPADDTERFKVDLTWLTSNWTCIFGQGCPGIYEGRPDDGCCTLGAHFVDADDVQTVRDVAKKLGPDEWQYRDEGRSKRGWTEKEDGELKTRVVDGACIFLNRPGFPAGAGCALHQHAVAEGVEPWRLKPQVCWQLPIRREFRDVELNDGTEFTEVTITEYDRRGWGPGGHDFVWYCSANPDAHVGAEPVFRSNEGELRELMGDAGYELLVEHCEAHLELVKAARDGAGRRMLPLLVHPATEAARDGKDA